MKVLKGNKILIALIVTFIFMISAYGLSFIGKKAHAIEGDGSKDNPYKIYTVDDLLLVEELCDHHGGYLPRFFELMDNIEIESDLEFEPLFKDIGFGGFEGFVGNFNGNGFSITGLTQSNNSSLFGVIGKDGVVEKLGLIDCDISLSHRSESQSDYIGALANINYGTIENCYVTGNITSDTGAAGLVGENYGTIKDSHNESIVNGKNGAGGIAGINGGTNKTPEFGDCVIINCYNTGNISGPDSVGGIAGCNQWEISNCYNTGAIEGFENVGGIAGNLNIGGSKITSCFNSGDIKGTAAVGGIVGNGNSEIRNCYNTGDIAALNNAGGIAGINRIDGTVSTCYSAAKFSVANNTIGGIIGVNTGGMAQYNYFNSEIAGNGICDVGGLMVVNTGYLATGQMIDDQTLENGYAMEYLQNDNVWVKRTNDGENLYYPELAVFYYSGDSIKQDASKESTRVQMDESGIFLSIAGWIYGGYNAELNSLRIIKGNNDYNLSTAKIIFSKNIGGTFVEVNSVDLNVETLNSVDFNNYGAGNYKVRVEVDATPNFGATFAEIYFTISKAVLTVTAENKTKIEGKENPELTYLISGFVNGEDKAVIKGEFDISTNATTSSYANDYAIKITIGTANAENYDFEFINGILTIEENPADPTKIDKSIFDSLVSVFTYRGSAQGPNVMYNEGYTISGTVSAVNAGKYGLIITLNNGYKWEDGLTDELVIEWEIKKVLLTITADNKTRVAGDDNPSLTYTITGFVSGESASIITGTFSLNTLATASSPAGNYKITIANNDATAANYSFEFVDGTLTVERVSSPGLSPVATGLMIGGIALVVLGAILMIVFISRRRKQKQL